MKKTEASTLLSGGYLGFIAEYRSSKPAEVPYVSKATGRSAIMKKVTHTLEVNGESVVMTEMLKDDANLAEYKAPAEKGASVLVHLQSLENDKGSIRARGRVEKLAS